jgi:hypothetical protein
MKSLNECIKLDEELSGMSEQNTLYTRWYVIARSAIGHQLSLSL